MTIRTEEPFKGLDDEKRYKGPCGHNNIGCFNIVPLDLYVCLVCGARFGLSQIKEVTE